MSYPVFDYRLSPRAPRPDPVDKTKFWYSGWQDDARLSIYEENQRLIKEWNAKNASNPNG